MDRATRDRFLDAVITAQVFDVAIVLGRDGSIRDRRVRTDDPIGLSGSAEGVTPLFERIHPDDLPSVRQLLETGSDGGTALFRVRVRHPFRSEWIDNEVLALSDEGDDELVICARVRLMGDAPLIERSTDAFSLAAAAPGGLALTDDGEGLLYANEVFTQLTGLRPGRLSDPSLPARLVAEVARIMEMTRAGHQASGTLEVDRRHLRITAAPVPDTAGEVVLAVDDVSETVEATRARLHAERQFGVAFQHSPVGIAVVSLDGDLLDVNPALCAMTGYATEVLRTMRWTDITHPEDLDDTRERVSELLSTERSSVGMESRYVRLDGSVVWVDLRIAVVLGPDGMPLHFVAQVIDITARKAIEDQLRRHQAELAHAATHDHLTGLPNRRLLMEHLEKAVKASRRPGGRPTAAVYLDLDRFKPVNDGWGHEAGDGVLTTVARRLRESCRESDVVSRVGGDEFVMLCELDQGAAEAVLVAHRLLKTLSAPHAVGPAEVVHVSGSIGITIVGPDDDVDSVLRRADTAAYAAKREGGGVRFCESDSVPG